MLISSSYLFLLPLNPAYALHAWLPLTLIFSAFLLFHVCKRNEIHFDRVTCFFFAFFLSLTISSVVNLFNGNEIYINHFLSIIILYFMYLVVPYCAFKYADLSNISTPLIYSFVIVTVFGFVDFLVVNTIGVSISEIVVRFPDNYSVGYGYFGGLFYRNKSFFQEPGFYAWYLNSIFPICFYLLRKQGKKTNILSILYASSVVTTFSATGVLGLAIVTLSFIFIYRNLLVRLVLLVFIPIVTFMVLGNVVYNIIFNKIISDSNSRSERFERWNDGLIMFSDNPIFGGGVGSYSLINESGLASFPLKILAETGLISFSILFGFIFLMFINGLRKYKRDPNILLVLSALATNILHWSTSTPYYMAFTWLNLALIGILVNRDE